MLTTALWGRSTGAPVDEQGRPKSGAFVPLLFFKPCGLKRHPSNGFDHFFTGIGLSEVSCAAHSFGGGARIGIVVSCDKDDGSTPALGGELLSEFNTGHSAELDVEHKAAELGTLRVSEE